MIIALKVGGSVLCPTESPDMDFVMKLAKTLKGLSSEHRMIAVVGGGRLARKMIADARKQGEDSNDVLHNLGIEASRKNAGVLIEALGDAAFSGIPRDEGGVRESFKSGKIIVLGGFRPGQTTDAVTLQSAEAVGAELVIIGTDVKGVYDRDPKKYSNAAFISLISVSELKDMTETESVSPGTKTIIDPVAVGVIEKTGLKCIVLDIRDMENLENAVESRDFKGTVIQ
ncbi:MAG: UMP kinase [Candidatus Aenigmarchaeota archaeon]|nr:UMP kinase [Candidatus Aenigmarchaeota archaeon]